MAGAKIVVIYPRPKNLEAFEKVYQREHVPMAVANLGGQTKIVATGILACPSPQPDSDTLAERITAQKTGVLARSVPWVSVRGEHLTWSSPCAGKVAVLKVRKRKTQAAIGYAARRS